MRRTKSKGPIAISPIELHYIADDFHTVGLRFERGGEEFAVVYQHTCGDIVIDGIRPMCSATMCRLLPFYDPRVFYAMLIAQAARWDDPTDDCDGIVECAVSAAAAVDRAARRTDR